MKITVIATTLLLVGLSPVANATIFRGNCEATIGAADAKTIDGTESPSAGQAQNIFWETELDTKNNEVVKNLHNLAGASIELAITPGAAAFADVMSVKVTTAKSEFELMSLLSSSGYGSIIYNGKLDGQSFALQCTVTEIKNEIAE